MTGRARSRWQVRAARLKPIATAIGMGGLAGLIATLTFRAMTWVQHLIWGPRAAAPAHPGRMREC
ncbi:hypothetical protein ACFSWE_00470 [Leucobacter albus]|uniref:Uncharacterized protein n=1 Tax=Leucobacter albus TaxID=272210 RepID=A0ABW3TQS5_9MICO